MTENQFIQELELAIHSLPAEERADILQDIREYFSNGRADGKSEEAIAAELGDPAVVANELVASFDFSRTEVPALNLDAVKDEFDNVDIRIENGMLHIVPSSDGKMHVDITDKNYKQQLAVNIVKRTLVISLTEESKLWGIFSMTRSMNTPTLMVRLPDRLYEKIEISSDHGGITGEGLAAAMFDIETENGSVNFSRIGAGSFIAASENGDVRLKAVQAKTLEAETENGQLILHDIHSGSVDATSDNGSITLKEIEGEIQAKTDNGRIHLVTDNLDRAIELETDNGSILLETRNQPENVTINAEVDWGSISVFGSKNRKTVFGRGEHSIDLHSDNGSITVKLI